MIHRQVLICFLIGIAADSNAQRDFFLDSPSGQLQVIVKVTDSIYYSLSVDGAKIVSPSAMTARKKGRDWYVSAMTDWTARELEVDLSFLEPGKFTASICEDGINAGKNGADYRLRNEEVDRSKKLKIRMASGGGFVAKITRDHE